MISTNKTCSHLDNAKKDDQKIFLMFKTFYQKLEITFKKLLLNPWGEKNNSPLLP